MKKAVNRFKMTNRRRDLLSYVGCRPCSDTLYYSGSSSIWSGTVTPTFAAEPAAMARYLDGYSRRATSLTVASMPGFEEINSTVGNRSRMNPVTHLKLQWVNKPYHLVHRHYAYTDTAYYMLYYRKTTARGYNGSLARLGLNLADQHPVGNDVGFSSRAFWSMRPKFEGEVSLVNSIFELKDFKDILHVGKVFRSFGRMADKMKRDITHGTNRVSDARLHRLGVASYANLNPNQLSALARDSSGAAASALLTMNLAIKPTIMDVMAITAQMTQSASDAQSTFGLYGGLGSSSHFSENQVVSSVTASTNNNFMWNEGTVQKITQTASMRSHYEYKMRSYNETLRRYWGLTGTAEALWNMLPLSFVLDYVLTVGKSLKFMRRDENVTNLITEYCESVKIELTDGLHLGRNPLVYCCVIDGEYFPSSSSWKYHLVSGTQYTRYSRKPMEPYKGPALPQFKLPSKNQAANMIALARLLLF